MRMSPVERGVRFAGLSRIHSTEFPVMTEYIVNIAFWLRAHDSFTVEAGSDADAIEKAKAAAETAMQSGIRPEHIEIAERREGIIAFIDRMTPDGRSVVIEDVQFDDDHIHGTPMT